MHPIIIDKWKCLIMSSNSNNPYSSRYLSSNVTWDIIQQNLDKPWNWDALSQNSSMFKLTLNDVETFKDPGENV